MSDADRKFLGQYTLHKLSVVSHYGSEADLLHIFSELNIFEDILVDSLSGNIHIHDSVNLISNLPIVGGETLLIKFSTAGKEDSPIDLKMVVHRISEKPLLSEKLRSYTLFFTTPENFINQQTQLVKYYEGPVSTIVGEIYAETFKGSKKKITIEKTKNIHSMIPCHWEPFFAFNYLSKYAVSKVGNKTGFLFYENLDGFHFRSLESLFEQPPFITYQKLLEVQNRNFKDDSYSQRLTHVQQHMVGETGQLLDAINMGAYGHQWMYVDIFNKKTVVNEYQYSNDFVKAKHVEKYPLIPKGVKGFDAKTSARFIKVIHPFSDKGNQTTANQLMLNKRHAILHQFGMTEETIVVYGDSEMRAGVVVEFDIPSPEKMDTNFKRERFYSGRSLVSAIRHTLTKEKYEMTLTLAKDSLSDDASKGGAE